MAPPPGWAKPGAVEGPGADVEVDVDEADNAHAARQHALHVMRRLHAAVKLNRLHSTKKENRWQAAVRKIRVQEAAAASAASAAAAPSPGPGAVDIEAVELGGMGEEGDGDGDGGLDSHPVPPAAPRQRWSALRQGVDAGLHARASFKEQVLALPLLHRVAPYTPVTGAVWQVSAAHRSRRRRRRGDAGAGAAPERAYRWLEDGFRDIYGAPRSPPADRPACVPAGFFPSSFFIYKSTAECTFAELGNVMARTTFVST